jgi:hypothetical protein
MIITIVYRIPRLPAQQLMTPENSPSKVTAAAAEKPSNGSQLS